MPTPSPIQDHHQALFLQTHNHFDKARLDLADATEKLEDCQSQLQIWQSKITQLQTEIANLQAIKQQYQEEVDSKSKILKSGCFVDRLVDEVLFYVFLYVAEGFSKRYPWLLMTVCKRWRRVCLDNPRLWSYFDLSCCRWCIRCHDTASVIRMLLQLERSRNAPLHVCLSQARKCRIQESKFGAIVKHLSRWESFSFNSYMDGQKCLMDIISPNSQFMALRRLRCYSFFRGTATQTELPFINDDALPVLRTVEMEHIGDTTILRRTPLGQLTSLSVKFLETDSKDLLSMLSSCTSLHSLTLLVCSRQADRAATPAATILLPHLSSLDLIEHNDRILPHILPNLQLPSLRLLNISIAGSASAVLGLIQISSCGYSLEKLALTYDPSVDGEMPVTTILQLCPKIQELSLATHHTHHSSMDYTVQNLIAHRGISTATDLCPNLRKLTLAVFEYDPVVMIQMIDSRSKANSVSNCLESVAIRYIEGPRDRETWEKYRLYCDDLLEQKFKDSPEEALHLTWVPLIFTYSRALTDLSI